jgi:hypothetical protein
MSAFEQTFDGGLRLFLSGAFGGGVLVGFQAQLDSSRYRFPVGGYPYSNILFHDFGV